MKSIVKSEVGIQLRKMSIYKIRREKAEAGASVTFAFSVDGSWLIRCKSRDHR